ncbi:hypothetical protein RI367_000075 [Sorochytrium milnesiophthora]
MDTDWCLVCDKHTRGGAYCSELCRRVDIAKSLRQHPLPSSFPPLRSPFSNKSPLLTPESSPVLSSSTVAVPPPLSLHELLHSTPAPTSQQHPYGSPASLSSSTSSAATLLNTAASSTSTSLATAASHLFSYNIGYQIEYTRVIRLDETRPGDVLFPVLSSKPWWIETVSTFTPPAYLDHRQICGVSYSLHFGDGASEYTAFSLLVAFTHMSLVVTVRRSGGRVDMTVVKNIGSSGTGGSALIYNDSQPCFGSCTSFDLDIANRQFNSSGCTLLSVILRRSKITTGDELYNVFPVWPIVRVELRLHWGYDAVFVGVGEHTLIVRDTAKRATIHPRALWISNIGRPYLNSGGGRAVQRDSEWMEETKTWKRSRLPQGIQDSLATITRSVYGYAIVMGGVWRDGRTA